MKPGQLKTIMVVDDDSVVHYLTEKALEAFNWVSMKYSAFNGREALQLFENYCKGLVALPDLILLDLHMPVMDGFQFLEAFSKINCLKHKQVVVAVFTASSCQHDKTRLVSLGVKHIFSKPVSIEKLSTLFNTAFQTTTH